MSTGVVKLSMYIHEADEWHHQPLHLAVLKMLREQGVSGATVIHAVAGFTLKGGVHTSSLVDTGGKLPLVIDIIDTEEKVLQVLPRLKEMAPHRLIVRHAVTADGLS